MSDKGNYKGNLTGCFKCYDKASPIYGWVEDLGGFMGLGFGMMLGVCVWDAGFRSTACL